MDFIPALAMFIAGQANEEQTSASPRDMPCQSQDSPYYQEVYHGEV
jgi:hypothetical protein